MYLAVCTGEGRHDDGDDGDNDNNKIACPGMRVSHMYQK